MRILLDTHMLLWALFDSPRLSNQARFLIERDENQIFYSAVAMWEIALKWDKHPDQLPYPPRELEEFCAECGFYDLPLNELHVFGLETLQRQADAPEHKDPFDRIMLSQAKVEDMLFLTHDRQFVYYDEPCVLLV